MLMKLTTEVNFINILFKVFPYTERYGQIDLIFTLLGSAHVKALCKTLMQLITRVNFINMLTRSFYVQNALV